MVNPLKKLLQYASKMEAGAVQAHVYGLPTIPDNEGLRRLGALQKAIETGAGNRERMNAALDVFEFLLGGRPRKKGVFHPSEVCYEDAWCERKFYFDIMELAPDDGFTKQADNDNDLMKLFDLGTMIHWYVQANLRRAGVLLEAEVDVNVPAYGVGGNMDGLLDDKGEQVALEVKSMNTFQFTKLTTPVEHQVKQASIYAHFSGCSKILMLYYDKNTSKTKEYYVPIDEAFVARFKTMAEGIMRLRTYNLRKYRSKDLSLHELPTRRVCPNTTCTRAQNCPYTGSCFSLPNF